LLKGLLSTATASRRQWSLWKLPTVKTLLLQLLPADDAAVIGTVLAFISKKFGSLILD